MTNLAPAPSRRIPYVLAGLAALLLWAFGAVADEVIEGDSLAFDNAVMAFFREAGNPNDPWGPPWLEEAMRDITGLGSFTVLGLVLVAVVLHLALSGKGRTALFVGFAVIGGTILSTGLKMVFDRPRPDVAAAARVFTASFPSGHATVSAVVYLTLGLLLAEAISQRRLKVYFIGLGVFLTVIVGVSRVYLGVHYPTDVLAGWSLGTAWALISWAGYSLLWGHDRRPTTPRAQQ
ncbi:MAG: phosphatase PAP2 family protein [Devosia sp.]|uniref:phosphatase PAP2 family protein n=1 Tax=Devosia sp. TaxID=1871048 RepID=UPI001AC04C38|nr:phosphatase PAP2 family protein [Devosia sp.]MBN9315868.1 phosphatase PAP2 family protein [Devosia sp.]